MGEKDRKSSFPTLEWEDTPADTPSDDNGKPKRRKTMEEWDVEIAELEAFVREQETNEGTTESPEEEATDIQTETHDAVENAIVEKNTESDDNKSAEVSKWTTIREKLQNSLKK